MNFLRSLDPILIVIVLAGISLTVFLVAKALGTDVQQAKDKAEIAKYKQETRFAETDTPREVMGDIVKLRAAVENEIKLRQKGLEFGREAKLSSHYELQLIKKLLFDLHDEMLTVSESKKQFLREMIQFLEEDYRGRVKQILQTRDGDRLGRGHQDTSTDGSGREVSEADVEPVSPPRNRVGF